MLGSSQPLKEQKLQGEGTKLSQAINSIFIAAFPEIWAHRSECKSAAVPALTSSQESPVETMNSQISTEVETHWSWYPTSCHPHSSDHAVQSRHFSR